MKRRAFISLLGGAAAWAIAARAQQPDRMRRIVVLSGIAHDQEAEARIASFVKGLAELGWLEGRNVRIEYRWAAGDAERARTYAVEVLGFGPDVILANSTTVVAALQRETRTVPIVFVLGLDPVESGFVSGLARGRARPSGEHSNDRHQEAKEHNLFHVPPSGRWCVLGASA
jgi:ABC-type uncharacterized transport system substrate-binding protein